MRTDSYPAAEARSISTRDGGLQAAPRQPTQIEALTRDLAQCANRLTLFNDNVEQKLETFHPRETNEAGRDPSAKDASPPDGTMAALHYQGNRLHIEVERYGRLWERLATII